jgi:hypothetical protein
MSEPAQDRSDDANYGHDLNSNHPPGTTAQQLRATELSRSRSGSSASLSNGPVVGMSMSTGSGISTEHAQRSGRGKSSRGVFGNLMDRAHRLARVDDSTGQLQPQLLHSLLQIVDTNATLRLWNDV